MSGRHAIALFAVMCAVLVMLSGKRGWGWLVFIALVCL